MSAKSMSILVLFTFLGMVCGILLAGWFQPAPVPVWAAGLQPTATLPNTVPLPTPDASGVIYGAGKEGATFAVPNPSAPASAALAGQMTGRSFTYQGLLRSAGLPVSNSCDFQFSLWDSLTDGAQIGATQTIASVSVANGVFTVLLNSADEFSAAAFNGQAAWIETGVRCPGGAGAYSLLAPRQALTVAPLAAGLINHTSLNATDTYSGFPGMTINAPGGIYGNPMGLMVTSSDHSNWLGIFNPVGIWTDSGQGVGLWATTNTGTAIMAHASGGKAAEFYGDVVVNGKLTVPRFREQVVINARQALPLTSGTFQTSGGTLILFYSGSGFAEYDAKFIGMTVKLDGTVVDQTGIFANYGGTHLAFVPKQWVLTGISAGSHTVTLETMVDTYTDFNDLFEVTVMELPY